MFAISGRCVYVASIPIWSAKSSSSWSNLIPSLRSSSDSSEGTAAPATCVAVCCSELQLRCSCVAVCRSVLQLRCGVLQCVASHRLDHLATPLRAPLHLQRVLQWVAIVLQWRCSVLQCVAVVVRCATVCCIPLLRSSSDSSEGTAAPATCVAVCTVSWSCVVVALQCVASHRLDHLATPLRAPLHLQRVLQCVAVCYNCVAVALQCVAVCLKATFHFVGTAAPATCVAVCCSELPLRCSCVAVCCIPSLRSSSTSS